MLVPLRVSEVMSDTVETVVPDAVITDVATRLRGAGIGSLVVVRDGRPVGIVTREDLVGVIADGADPDRTVVADVMSAPLVTVEADLPVESAAGTIREHGIKHLPVTEDDRLVGVVTATDLSYYLPRLSLGRSWRDGRASAALGTDETAYEAPDWTFSATDPDAEGVSVGDAVRFRKRLSAADVRSFANASGDTNRLHLDEAFAAETRFGRRIVHGTLVSGLVSAALARIPGLTIYLSQDLRFLGPVDIGEVVTAVCEVVDALGDGKYRLETAVYDGDGERVIDGEAVVLVDDLPYTVEETLEPIENEG
jgi:acyl dehydratase/CBS domain-containing protein